MPRLCRRAVTAAAFLLLATTVSGSQVEVTTPIKISASVIGPSTCPSRSINYITQTLPQQCLTTSWVSKPTTSAISLAETSSTIRGSAHAPSSIQDARTVTSDIQGSAQSAPADLSMFSGSATPATSYLQGAPSVSVTSENAQQVQTTVEVEQETESDSPLDNANFLSFEEWKKQNLAKAGQSAEDLRARTGGSAEQRRRSGGINIALDSLGEDTEIEIDFGGFVGPGNPTPMKPPPSPGTEQKSNEGRSEDKPADELSGPRKRGKDAGKTCKERSNYASFDCASTVLKTNPECKGSNAVLMENKDSYMLNICSAKNKFFIVELCDDILIDTVVLANFEFFSSMFRTFRVSVSDRYPVKLDKWKELGTFEARNSREVQAFLVENPLIWARYLRVELLTHFGNEYYCPVSLLRVHGTTMMEEFNHDVKGSRGDDDSDGEAGDVEEGDLANLVPADVVTADALKEKARETSEAAGVISTGSSSAPTARSVDVPSSTVMSVSDTVGSSRPKQSSSPGFTLHNISLAMQMAFSPAPSERGQSVCRLEDLRNNATSSPSSTSLHGSQTERIPKASSAVVAIRPPPHATMSSNDHVTRSPDSSATTLPVVSNKGATQNNSDPIRSSSNQTSASSGRTPSSSTQPANPNPTTQESFFKSVHKRLQLLESNSTLSLQYIEEQSRILRDAFSKVEKRQLGKTTSFLETLNTTVLTELRDFRHQYDQIWQSTVLELSSQREQSQHEVLALSARLSLLADEIVFQKRMAIVQFGLILLCLGLIIFSRHSSQATYLELPPTMQNAITKSPANFSRQQSAFESPPNSPPSTRPPSRYGLFRGFTQQQQHRSSPSEESQLDDNDNGRKRPNIESSPRTPTSLTLSSSVRNRQNAVTSDADEEEQSSDCSPEREEDGARRQTKSGPSTPSGHRDEQQQRGLAERTLLQPDSVR